MLDLNKWNETCNFYVYSYHRNDGTPYYVGKGKGKRAWKHTKRDSVSPPESKALINIVEKNLTEIGALAIERRLIRWYGRKDNGTGILRNLTDGGDGACGYKHTEEAKEKIKQANSGKKYALGTHRTEEQKRKMSLANLGKIRSEDTKKKLSEVAKGRIISPETRKKMSEKRIGSKNHRFGKVVSQETRRKISEAKIFNSKFKELSNGI